MRDQLNAEEREILEKFERGELRRAAGSEAEMESARHMARSTFKKTRRVNLRVTERDFNLAHARAREEGIRSCPKRSWRLRWLPVDSCYAATSSPSTGGVPSSSRCALRIQRSL